MAKKMTAKEFWQIIWDAEERPQGEKDFERVLNALVGYEYNNAKTMDGLGLEAGAEACRSRARSIYDALDARGYYDDVK